MRRLNYILSLGMATVAGFGASGLVFGDEVGPVSGKSGVLVETSKGGGEVISARPLRGSAQAGEGAQGAGQAAQEGSKQTKGAPVQAAAAPVLPAAPVVEKATLEPAKPGDNWLSIDKPVVMAAREPVRKVAVASGPNGELPLVETGHGFRPVTPGYALTPSVPFTTMPGQVYVAGGFSATQYNNTSTYSGYSTVAGNGYMNVARYGPGGFPPYQYPYRGYNNNPFTGLSSYSNGYAGAPPSTVPFNGGWFQGRSAFYSQPSLVVPVVPVYPVYPVYPVGGCGPMRGGYAPVVQSGSSINVSVGYSGSF